MTPPSRSQAAWLVCPLLTTDTRPSSLDDEDDDCATFAYQWNTGTISGDVDRAVKDPDVSISADTETTARPPATPRRTRTASSASAASRTGPTRFRWLLRLTTRRRPRVEPDPGAEGTAGGAGEGRRRGKEGNEILTGSKYQWLWRVDFHDPRLAPLLVLLKSQSTPDPRMAWRMVAAAAIQCDTGEEFIARTREAR